ncbi:hypothetical protein H310_11470 [Aphanomyces invadans]|uniref:Chromo domain-containing protein n=1 Tax=Aphanomyces invadans TaxID=157072 RepID=A0A024TMF2_9STRA|nr:hypothetical protein H310_11470 [Aphanomyces invadans]ETV94796.1 hypothetical protein H310_11470 [Aphanomyces invadans]|eukprot:XP_008876387.1 hypothetical protein H310_11470 [Aphanomyces invadans]
MYSKAANGMAEDLLDQVAYGEGGFHFETVMRVREVDGQFQVLVKWQGIEDDEASKESAVNLYEGVPVLLQKWVASTDDQDNRPGMRVALEMTLGHISGRLAGEFGGTNSPRHLRGHQ